jgi:hydroxymethylglutaryl-CoA lyase
VAKMVVGKEALDVALDQYISKLKVAAPKASTMVKELVSASLSGDQAKRIKDVFDEMMKPGSESEFGLENFQAGRRNIDWDDYVEKKGKPKL